MAHLFGLLLVHGDERLTPASLASIAAEPRTQKRTDAIQSLLFSRQLAQQFEIQPNQGL